jgi:hypothetical protein
LAVPELVEGEAEVSAFSIVVNPAFIPKNFGKKNAKIVFPFNRG